MGTLLKAVFFQEKRPHIFRGPGLVVYVAQGCFLFKRNAKYFWKPLTCGCVAAGALFFLKNGPHTSGSP